MEFKSLRNIESSFRQIRLFGIVFLSLCAVVTVWSVWNSYRFAEKQREKIYVLDNGKSADARSCLRICRRTARRRHGNMCAVSTRCSSRYHLKKARLNTT